MALRPGDLLLGLLVVAIAAVGLLVVTLAEARDAVDFNVMVLIAASFGLGMAMVESGLAEIVGGGMTGGFGRFGDLALLAGVLVTTMGLAAALKGAAVGCART